MTTTASRTNGRSRVPRLTDQPGLKAALLAVQAEAPKLIRDVDGQIGSRSYKYADLDQVTDATLPLLVQHELLWTVKVTVAEDGTPQARYRMEHVPSGDVDEWTGPLPCVDPGPQALGSAITYMRRYTLQAYLNLAPGEDDDGRAASPLKPVDRYAEDSAQNSAQMGAVVDTPQPTARPPESSERRITANQREKLLKPRARQAKLTDGEFANVILTAAGDQPREWRSPEHATQTLDRLLDQLPARLKDAVLAGIDGAKP